MTRTGALARAGSGLAAIVTAFVVSGCAAPRSTVSRTPNTPPSSPNISPSSLTTAPSSPTASPATAQAPVAGPTPARPLATPAITPAAAQGSPHFADPDAAMRYLVDAYNRHDVQAEMHVTTPDSRAALENEREWVKTFTFRSCAKNADAGDYSCVFDMAELVDPASSPSSTTFDGFGYTVAPMNEITVLVAPADRPGWYMYYNMGCGDAAPTSPPPTR